MAITFPKKQKEVLKIEPSIPEDVNFLGEGVTLSSEDIKSRFSALDFNREQQALNLQKVNEIFDKNPELANTYYGDELKTSKTFEGLGGYFWNQLSLSKVVADNLFNFGVAEKDVLTETEWQQSDYYREGMKFPKYKIGMAEAMEMAKIYDENETFKTIENLSSPTQKVARFVGSIGIGLVTDPITTLATGGIGGVGVSLTKAMFIAGATNFLADELIYQVNKTPLENAGIHKTQEERNFERGIAFLGGAAFEGVIKGVGKVYNKYKKPNPTETIEQKFNDIKKQVETDIKSQEANLETKPVARVNDIVREFKKDKDFFNKFLNNNLTEQDYAKTGFTQEELANRIEAIKQSENLTTAQQQILKSYSKAFNNLPTSEQKSFLTAITENPELVKKIQEKQITPEEYASLGFTEEFANATIQKRNEAKKLETSQQVSAETQRRLKQYLKQQSRKERELKRKPSDQERADKVNAIMQGREQLEALRKGNSAEFDKVSNNPKRNKSNQTIKNEFLPTELEIPEIGKIKVEYEIVSRKDLIYSNNANGEMNPMYPLKFQPRDRRIEADPVGFSNVVKIANNIDTNKLIRENGGLQSGSPLILDNNVVIVGNGRMMAFEMAYKEGKSENYKTELQRLFPQSNASQIEDPVLIRRLVSGLDDEDIKLLSLKANDSPTDSYSAIEKIKLNANIIEENNLMQYYKGGDLNSKQNEAFFTKFFSRVSPTKLKDYIYEGQLTNAGILDLESAITQVAYGDPNLTKNIHVNSENEVSKTIISALKDFAPRIAQIKDKMRQGIVEPSYDISGNFAEAFNLYYISDNPSFLASQINSNGGFFEFEISQTTELILRSFFKDEFNLEKVMNKKDLFNFFENYWGEVERTKTAGLFEGIVKDKTPLEVLQKSRVLEGKTNIFEFQGENIPLENGILQEIEVGQILNKLYAEKKIQTANTLNQDNKKVFLNLSKTEVLAREDVRFGYAKDLTSEVKKGIEGEQIRLGRALTKEEQSDFYKKNADLINIAVFGMRAKEFKELYPNLAKYGNMLNQRDFASGNELLTVGELQKKLGKMIDEFGLINALEKYEEVINFSDEILGRLNPLNPSGTKRPDIDAFESEILRAKNDYLPEVFNDWVNQRTKLASEINLSKAQEFLACLKS